METAMTTSAPNPMAIDGRTNQEDSGLQHLTFILAQEEYGVEILRVVEIKGWTPVTRIPNTPDFVKGVLNLRGTIVPIIDLRIRFNLDEAAYTPTTVVIVLSIQSESGSRTVGIVVDGVSDVLNVKEEEIKPAPDFGSVIQMEFIRGLAALDERMVMLLDIDRLLSPEEMVDLETLSAEQ